MSSSSSSAMSLPVEDNAADTLPRASHSPRVRVGGRTEDPVWSEFVRTQHKKGYWAVCKHCGGGMMDKVAVALAHIRGCSVVPEELKAAYCSAKAEPAAAAPGASSFQRRRPAIKPPSSSFLSPRGLRSV